MNIGITGASGFIGRHLLIACIDRGYAVRVLSRKSADAFKAGVVDVKLFTGDLLDKNIELSDFVDDLDILFHCAGEIVDEKKMLELHVNGTKRLLSAANGNIKRWVQLSSVGTYGQIRDGVVVEESLENPNTQYEITKTRADELVIDAGQNGGLVYTILRPSNVFGIGMPNQSLIQLIKSIRQGYFFYMGKPSAYMNYVHVSNVVEALLLCGEHKRAANSTYIISDHTSLHDLVTIISHAIGVTPPLARIPEWMARAIALMFQKLPSFPLTVSRIDALTGNVIYKSSKIENELGFCRKITLSDSFREFAEQAGRI